LVVDHKAAIDLLRPLVVPTDSGWADFGAGSGTFTRALCQLLNENAVVYAIDRDPKALEALDRLTKQSQSCRVVPILGDLGKAMTLPPLDGVLLANVLHYVPTAEQPATLARAAGYLTPQGRLAALEYDNRPASRWVPYPVSRDRLREIASQAGLSVPAIVSTRPSAFGGILYLALLRQR
jgi:trans-aconitate methyltransferase